MAQTIAARKVKLHDLKAKFELRLTQDESFFTEWREDLPPVTEEDQRVLDRIKRNYLYLLEYLVMEKLPAFGVVLNGSEILFLKLVRGESSPFYATSVLDAEPGQ